MRIHTVDGRQPAGYDPAMRDQPPNDVPFRDRLLGTLRALQPILEVPGVLVAGSEVPNLLEPGAAATLVVSRDVDIAIPLTAHEEVKSRLGLISGLSPSAEEPSVWVPGSGRLLEANFIGYDPRSTDLMDTRVLEDAELPIIVFGLLALLEPGACLTVEGLRVPLPRVATLLMEKLATERSGLKGDRDLLVALGLLMLASDDDRADALAIHRRLPAELRHAVETNVALLSLLGRAEGMPDPVPQRQRVAEWLRALEKCRDDD